jgi:flagellar motility protein MotE (MotC chaperone)
VMENLPRTADKQAALNDAKRKAFNKAVLATTGENADQATPGVLKAAKDRIGGEFQSISGRNNVVLNDQFIDELAKVDGMRNEFSSPSIKAAVDKAIDFAARAEKKGSVSGQEYQKVRSTLTKAANDAFNAQNSELGQALKSIRNALDDQATQSVSSADSAAWKGARKQYQALKVVADASKPVTADAVQGNVSPAKLAAALTKHDPTYQYGSKAQPQLDDLARIGQLFVKEQIPNSGTADRTFWQRFLENPLNATWQQGFGGISSPVQSAMNTPAGQRYLTKGLLPMTPQQKLALALTGRSAGTAIPLSVIQSEK